MYQINPYITSLSSEEFDPILFKLKDISTRMSYNLATFIMEFQRYNVNKDSQVSKSGSRRNNVTSNTDRRKTLIN